MCWSQRCICIMDLLKGPSLQISSCSSLHRPIGAPNNSSYFMRNVGGKRESLSFYCPDRPLYIENVALRAMYSLSLLEHVQSTHEHSMYSMISMVEAKGQAHCAFLNSFKFLLWQAFSKNSQMNWKKYSKGKTALCFVFLFSKRATKNINYSYTV
jgi:hypothetical protein